jgi:hypothetical protein
MNTHSVLLALRELLVIFQVATARIWDVGIHRTSHTSAGYRALAELGSFIFLPARGEHLSFNRSDQS